MTTADILQAVSGVPRPEAIRLLAAAIGCIAAEPGQTNLAGAVHGIAGAIPVKKRKNDPFQPVWEYLATVREYETLKGLWQHLVDRFGKDSTPSISLLSLHLRKGRGK